MANYLIEMRLAEELVFAEIRFISSALKQGRTIIGYLSPESDAAVDKRMGPQKFQFLSIDDRTAEIIWLPPSRDGKPYSAEEIPDIPQSDKALLTSDDYENINEPRVVAEARYSLKDLQVVDPTYDSWDDESGILARKAWKRKRRDVTEGGGASTSNEGKEEPEYNGDIEETGYTLTRQEYAEEVAKIKPLPTDIFYVKNDIEVIRNPSERQQRSMTADARRQIVSNPLNDPLLRSTNDKRGNTWIWKAHEGMHSYIEPTIEARERVKVNQNNRIPTHREVVRDAVRSGLTVPKKVQEEYPEYKKFFVEAAKRILSGETHLKEDDQYTGYNILQQAKRLAAADGKDWADVSRNEKEKQDYFAAAKKEMGLEEEEADRYYKTILVYDKDGKVVQSYAPNNIGATRNELLTQAEKLAQKIGGTVKEEAYEIGTDEYRKYATDLTPGQKYKKENKAYYKGLSKSTADKRKLQEAKTIKVGEDSIGASSTAYALVKERKILALGEKEEMLQRCESDGGRVWVVSGERAVGDLVESVESLEFDGVESDGEAEEMLARIKSRAADRKDSESFDRPESESKTRPATKRVLQHRAIRLARNLVFKKESGGKTKSELLFPERLRIEKIVASQKDVVMDLARQLYPIIDQKEQDRKLPPI